VSDTFVLWRTLLPLMSYFTMLRQATTPVARLTALNSIVHYNLVYLTRTQYIIAALIIVH